jgi:hypothetical protein
MVVLVARYFARAGNGDDVEAALKEMAALVRAREQDCVL